MNRSALALAAALSVTAIAAQAETPDAAGQFATPATATASRAQVEAQFADYRKAGVNPWSISYNPLKGFQAQKTRAQVTGEYLASRNAVSAMTGEDSGSAYLAGTRGIAAGRFLAGTPVNAQ